MAIGHERFGWAEALVPNAMAVLLALSASKFGEEPSR
jgi:hypothetical protein